MESSVEQLPVAIIGAGGFGSQTLHALLNCPRVKLVGLADRDASLAARLGAECNVPAYGDNRSLLAETRPRAVFAAVPPAAAGDVLELCASRGIHLWKEMPLGRTIEEAAAFVRRAEQANIKLAVGTQRRFADTYRRAHELRGKLGDIFLGRTHYLFNWGPRLAWRGDKASGGGALIELGYHHIDLIIWSLGLPEAVYGLTTCGRRMEPVSPEEKLQPPYDTDDTACVIMRYANGTMVTCVTTRVSGPVSEELIFHGRCGSLRADAEQCVLRDADGSVLESLADPTRPATAYERQVDAFAQAVLDDATYYPCSGRENLLNVATIEAIYLSDRTAQPENPRERLRSQGFTAEDCRLYIKPTTASSQ
ncbi:MAG: Gfo/Idh/MocA family oxidoreductase [Phycisphaerae bacterium]|nr:Gfo/Idh/MocA family oxidoreductase [Phycisphaerae bacterium]